MPQTILDKADAQWRGLSSQMPAHKIGPLEAQTFRNGHIDSGRLEKDTGFKKVLSTTQYQPGIFFRDPNVQTTEWSESTVGRVAYVRIPHHSDLSISSDTWTIEFKIKVPTRLVEADRADECILSKGDESTNNRNYEIYLDSDRKIRAEFDDGGAERTLTSTTALSLDTTYHVAVRRNGTAFAIFLDGVSDNSTTVTDTSNTDTNTQPLILGMRLLDGVSDGSRGPKGSHGQDHFFGYLDEVRIWSTNRSGASILANIDNELDSGDKTNLVGYWKFNEGTGTTSACDSDVSNASSKTADFKWIGPTWVNGLVDESKKGAWDFDGYADMGAVYSNSAVYDPVFADGVTTTPDWTVECNVKPDDVSSNQTVLFMGDETAPTGNDLYFVLRITSGGVFQFLYSNGSALQTVNSNINLTAGNHYHVAIGRDAGIGFIRVWDITNEPDAIVVNTATYYTEVTGGSAGATTPNTAHQIYVGANVRLNSTSSAQFLDGTVDEIRIWSTDRGNIDSEDLIIRYGNSTLTGNEDGLIGYWPLDDYQVDLQLGDPIASDNASDYANNILGFPNSLPPVWTNGLVTTTTLDSDGTTILNAPAKITMIAPFSELDDTTEEVIYGQGCNLYSLSSGTATEIAKGLEKDEYLDYSIYANAMFILSANNNPRAYIDDAVYPMGIPKPNMAPIATANASVARGFQNKRQYVFTWYDERTGREGSASPTSAIVDNAGAVQAAYVTCWPTANQRATHVRVYGTISTNGTPGTQYYRIAEVKNTPYVLQGQIPPITASTSGFKVLDDFSDLKLQARPQLTLLNDPPRRSRYLKSYMDRMYLVDDEFPNRLYFSALGNPESVGGLSFQNYEENDGDEITALALVRAKLVVGKDTSVWEQPVGEGGQLTLPLRPRPRHRDHGIASHWSVAQVELNLIVYLNAKGFFAYDGTQYRYLSEAIEDQVNNLDESRLSLAYGANYRHRWEYQCAVTTDGETDHDVVWSFYYRGEGAWIKRTQWQANVIAGLRNIRDRDEQFLIGTQQGYLMLYDNGVPSGQQNFGAGAASDLSGTATGGSTSTIEDSGASWPTTNDGLKGIYATVIDAATEAEESFVILSNTATEITFGPVRSAAVVSGDTYRIGQIDWLWQSRDESIGDSVKQDRFLILDAHHTQQSTGSITTVFRPDRTQASDKTATMDVSTRKRSRLFINKRATFLSVIFRDATPNEPKDIESYALTLETQGKAPDPART